MVVTANHNHAAAIAFLTLIGGCGRYTYPLLDSGLWTLAVNFPFTLRTLNLDESQPRGDFASRWKLGDVLCRRNPLHFAPSIGHRATRQRHPLDGCRRHDDHRVVYRQRFLRFAQLLDVRLRVRRVVFGQAHQREVLLLPEIGITDVDVVDGGALEAGNVIALVQHC